MSGPRSPFAPASGDDAAHGHGRGASAIALVAGPLNGGYRNDALLGDLSARFVADGFVKLPDLLCSETMAILRHEVAALEPLAQARDFVMPGSATPRMMSVLGAGQLLEHSAVFALLYVHFELSRLISRVASAPIYGCRHPDELMVCNFLLSTGSTHGWHLDDPAYALVVVLEAPPLGAGGELEYIPAGHEIGDRLRLDPSGPVQDAVERARTDRLIRVVDHRPGDAYLLRADRCLHRVVPLSRPGARRVALNFAYERTATPVYGESATLLYGHRPAGESQTSTGAKQRL